MERLEALEARNGANGYAANANAHTNGSVTNGTGKRSGAKGRKSAKKG